MKKLKKTMRKNIGKQYVIPNRDVIFGDSNKTSSSRIDLSEPSNPKGSLTFVPRPKLSRSSTISTLTTSSFFDSQRKLGSSTTTALNGPKMEKLKHAREKTSSTRTKVKGNNVTPLCKISPAVALRKPMLYSSFVPKYKRISVATVKKISIPLKTTKVTMKPIIPIKTAKIKSNRALPVKSTKGKMGSVPEKRNVTRTKREKRDVDNVTRKATFINTSLLKEIRGQNEKLHLRLAFLREEKLKEEQLSNQSREEAIRTELAHDFEVQINRIEQKYNDLIGAKSAKNILNNGHDATCNSLQDKETKTKEKYMKELVKKVSERENEMVRMRDKHEQVLTLRDEEILQLKDSIESIRAGVKF